jgi:6-phosphogluconolactonase/glucosamine-6-phosphate isomerase/deaminase
VGIKTIMEARGILLLAFEENKSEVVTGALEGPMDDSWYEGKRYDANKEVEALKPEERIFITSASP